MTTNKTLIQLARPALMRCLYIVTNDGEPLYRRSFEENNLMDLKSLPTFIKNSVVLFHSSPSTSSERVYTLAHDDSVWAYAFFRSFALVALSKYGQQLTPMKSMMLALGRNLMNQYGEIIRSWSGSMSDVIDLDNTIDEYVSMNLSSPSESLLDSIDQLIDSTMEQHEISFVGVFDPSGKMLRGNVPEAHLFRLEVEISQGRIKPVMDIVPTSIISGEHKVQLFRVNSLTIAVASDPSESALNAVSTIGSLAHSLNELLLDSRDKRQK